MLPCMDSLACLTGAERSANRSPDAEDLEFVRALPIADAAGDEPLPRSEDGCPLRAASGDASFAALVATAIGLRGLSALDLRIVAPLDVFHHEREIEPRDRTR